MTSRHGDRFIPATEIVLFAVDKIATIKSVLDINAAWNGKITNITQERHDLMRESNPMAFLATIHRVLGQDNYFFTFRESSDIHGEFSVDFIPNNPSKVLREALGENIEKRIANWRIQVFVEGLFARRKVFKKHLAILKRLLQRLGEPLDDDTDREWVLQLKEMQSDWDVWEYNIVDRQYAVTLRTLPESETNLGSISFSISEL